MGMCVGGDCVMLFWQEYSYVRCAVFRWCGGDEFCV